MKSFKILLVFVRSYHSIGLGKDTAGDEQPDKRPRYGAQQAKAHLNVTKQQVHWFYFHLLAGDYEDESFS